MDSEFLKQTILDHNRSFLAGMDAEQRTAAAFRGIIAGEPEAAPPVGTAELALIIREYDKCKDFENVRIPQRLALAIEAARKAAK